MKTKSLIIYSAIVILALPMIWLIMKVAGADDYLLYGFWWDFKWWGLGAAVLLSIVIFISYKTTRK